MMDGIKFVRIGQTLPSLACVAGRISRMSAFVLVANASGEAARELVKSRVEFTSGFAAREFPHVRE